MTSKSTILTDVSLRANRTLKDENKRLREALEKIEKVLGYKYAGEDEIDKAYQIIETALQKAKEIHHG